MSFSPEIKKIIDSKGKKQISMLTCYDYTFARVLSATDIDMILVGDSMANVVLGLETTKEIGFREMLAHTAAVKKGAPEKFVVADMPYNCCQRNRKKTLSYARAFIEEGGADAVKLEWFKSCPQVCAELTSAGIPVMGHIGLTPQTADKIGGFKVQGKDQKRGLELIEQARIFQENKVFSLVLECVPWKLAQLISSEIAVPTIGIGSGKYCDGQVLVFHDLLGLYTRKVPKFVKAYADLAGQICSAADNFSREVKQGKFPSEKESYSLDEEEFKKIKKNMKKT